MLLFLVSVQMKRHFWLFWSNICLHFLFCQKVQVWLCWMHSHPWTVTSLKYMHCTVNHNYVIISFSVVLRMYQFHTHTLAWLQSWSLGKNTQLINYAPIIFSLELIWIDWFFDIKNQLNSSDIKLEEDFLLGTPFDYFHFWSPLFSEIRPNFWRAPINPNKFW